MEEFANCNDVTEAIVQLNNLIIEKKVNNSLPAHVVIGRDTRPSSFGLFECACRGVEAMGGIVHDIGTVTTPQLHFVVRELNRKKSKNPESFPNARQELHTYYSTLSNGYLELKLTSLAPHPDRIVIDCSNGIGSRSVVNMINVLNASSEGALTVDIRNGVGDGPVNEGCGAEIVQKEQHPPIGVSEENNLDQIMCSFDGDADRIVFHSFNSCAPDSSVSWSLADGDKIACLLALILKEELQIAGFGSSSLSETTLTIGVVQTAYANGSSTHFLRSKGIPVVFAKTGVKYLHRKAHDSFDVAIYFEANGHGTVLFSQKFDEVVSDWATETADVNPRVILSRKRIMVCITLSGERLFMFLKI